MKKLSAKSIFIVLVVAEVLLAASLVLPGIGDKSLWLDESATIQRALNPDWYWTGAVGQDPNMWLYYAAMWGWCKFGVTEVRVRLFSALFALACIPMIVRVGTRLFSRSAGLLAGLLLTIHPFFIEYAQEARSYSVMIFMSLWATDLFIRMISSSSARSGGIYGLAVVLGVYVQFYIAVLSFVHAVTLLTLPLRKWPWRNLVVSVGVIVVGMVLMVTFVGPRNTAMISWMTAPSTGDLVYVCRKLLGSGHVSILLYAVCVVAAAVLAFTSRGSRWPFGFLVLSTVLSVLLAYAIAVFYIPLFQPRILIFVVPMIVLVAGGVLAKVRPAFLTIILVASFAYGSVAPVKYVLNKPSLENWRGLTEHVRRDGHGGDVLIAHARYLIGPVKTYERINGALPVRLFDFYTVEAPVDGSQNAPADKYIAALAEEHERLWLVLGHNNFTHLGADEETAKLMNSLESYYTQEAVSEYGSIKLLLWVRE